MDKRIIEDEKGRERSASRVGGRGLVRQKNLDKCRKYSEEDILMEEEIERDFLLRRQL